jgi:hypothetical protein
MTEKMNVYRTAKPEGKRPLGRLRLGWMDNIETNVERENGMSLFRLIWLRTGSNEGLL